MYYTKCKRENINPDVDNHPYYIVAETKQPLNDNYPTNVKFYAVSAKTNKKLGQCVISRLSDTSKGLLIRSLDLLDHEFDHCGIGSTLLNVAENYAYQKLGLDFATLVCSPDDGYEEAVSNLYYGTGYGKISALNQLLKELNENTLQKKINLDDIKFVQIQKPSVQESNREM